MDINDKFKELSFKCQKVLPLVYDESLSYYEVLCKLQHTVNELISFVNSIDFDNSKYVNKKIDELKRYVDRQDLYYFQKITDDVNEKILKLRNDITIILLDFEIEINKQMDVYKNNINNQLVNFETKYNTDFIKFEEKIIKLIDDNCILCFNPTNGKHENPCKVINDIYNFIRIDAFTCLLFDISSITCSDFDNNISCKDFDMIGLVKLKKKYCDCVALDVFKGGVNHIQQIFYSIVEVLGNGVTALIFDNLKLSSSNFDNKEITAQKFDFSNIVAQ